MTLKQCHLITLKNTVYLPLEYNHIYGSTSNRNYYDKIVLTPVEHVNLALRSIASVKCTFAKIIRFRDIKQWGSYFIIPQESKKKITWSLKSIFAFQFCELQILTIVLALALCPLLKNTVGPDFIFFYR